MVIINNKALTTFLAVVLLSVAFLTPTLIVMSPVAEAADPGDVLISEVLYDSPGTCDDPNAEWVELYNNSGSSISLNNWQICDNTGCDTLPDYTVDAGEEVVVVAYQASFTNCGYSCASGHTIYLENRIGGYGLNNDGDRVYILDNSSNEIDAMSWDDDTYAFDPPCSDVSEGHSLERYPTNTDTNSADDWRDQSSPNPCETNPTAITLSSLTAHPTSPQPTFFRWQWLALVGAVGIVLEVVLWRGDQ
jgi:hypothetical protein